MDFIKSVTPPTPLPPKAYFFIFSSSDILIHRISDTKTALPCMENKAIVSLGFKALCFFGTHKNIPCYCGKFDPDKIPPAHEFIKLRALYTSVEDIFWLMAGYARQIHDWNINFKFCGRCGTRTKKKENEFARVCPSCELHHYPRISMDPSEILEASWFDADHLPMIPDKKVLAGELIDWFVRSQKPNLC